MRDLRPGIVLGLAAVLLTACGASAGAGGDHTMTGSLLDPPFVVDGSALVDGN